MEAQSQQSFLSRDLDIQVEPDGDPARIELLYAVVTTIY